MERPMKNTHVKYRLGRPLTGVRWRNAALYLVAGAFLLAASCHNADEAPGHVTFTENIAPIFYAHCSICHRPGGSAHFALVTYDDARKNAGAIAFEVKERLMPPWPADPHYTQFLGQRLLTNQDIAMIVKWAADGAPEGPKSKLPALPEYPEGSTVGTPDARVPVPPYYLKKNSYDQFLMIKVPFELPRDTFASLIEFVPGSHNIVHHENGDLIKYDYDKKKNVFDGERWLNTSTDTATLKEAYARLGLPNDDGTYPVLQKSVVNYLPGVAGQRYPEGIGGYRIPRKGAFFLNDIHYGFTGKEDVTDSSYINIFYAKSPPKRPVMEFQLGTLSTFNLAPVEPDLIIQANTTKEVYSRFTVQQDISVLTVNPHMHLLGKSFKGYALKPDGDTIRLISIPRWDFNWQYFYTFPKMVKIPRGSTIVAEGVYDNTKENLNNPFSPPRVVTGTDGSMKSTDEMFQFIITYLPYQPGDENISLDATRR